MDSWTQVCRQCVTVVADVPPTILLAAFLATAIGVFVLFYILLSLVAPVPRESLPEEKKYRTLAKDGTITTPEPLPCWLDKQKSSQKPSIDEGEIFMSVVIPAYNEEDRLSGMLEEAVNYLEHRYGTLGSEQEGIETRSTRKRKPNGSANGHASGADRGWEIILVSDGSTDRTEEVAFRFAKDHQLSLHPKGNAGPWTPKAQEGGGAVTHGMRHVRGKYVVFADADGASKFEDLGKLVTACSGIEDAGGRGVAVGSRAHMVGSEAVVKRSKLRNFLMHSFHLILWLMTPPRTATVKDTQCGFKLFSRAALPYIIPNMHSEGWIFDVEMLMLAEFAQIPVAEVPVGWREVKGSKLNVLRDSIGMAWGLALLRAAWSLGIYRQK
ncbi:Dolichyl-phosphate beta-glucosyltransferase [Penicillium malachiteum]|uniref:dolichyl-phosphate beta-glucosyltransferase n=1 Tax=Penicillium malachiteum TaxID=1324776 RepID=A0AAD6HCR4_9EURO|nr:Dolichyl-phosphate beta-glucosyltransferase [Penicillium malachiteum]